MQYKISFLLKLTLKITHTFFTKTYYIYERLPESFGFGLETVNH